MAGTTLNVSNQARKLIDELRSTGFGGIRFPEIRPSCVSEWRHNYACIGAVYWDYPNTDYFDHARFEFDFLNRLRELFPGCEVNWRKACQELEIYFRDPFEPSAD